MRRSLTPLIATLLALLLACACGGSPAAGGRGGSDSEGRAAESDASTDSGPLTLEWRSEPTPIPLNEPFELYVRARDTAGEVPPGAALGVEAWMPGHGHGMLRQPVAELQPDGWFRVRGMLFHMAGEWELRTRVGWREEEGEHFAIRSQLATFEVEL